MLENLEETKPAEEENTSITLSQLLGVVYSGSIDAPEKGVLVTDVATNLKLLPLDSPTELVEEFLVKKINDGSIIFPTESAATTQLWQMQSTVENLLPAIDFNGFTTTYCARIDSNEALRHIDSVNGADTFEIPVIENGERKSFLLTDKAFCNGLANCQVVTAGRDTILLVPVKGDPQAGRAWLFTVALSNETDTAIGHSGPAGEMLLSRFIDVLFRDIEPIHGGERRPFLGRLIDFYHIGPEEFIVVITEHITKQLSDHIKSIYGIQSLLAKRSVTATVKKVRSDLERSITSTKQLLDFCVDGLKPDQGRKTAKNALQIQLNTLVDEAMETRNVAALLQTMVKDAAVGGSEYYKPAEIVAEFQNLGKYLVGENIENDSPAETSELADITTEEAEETGNTSSAIQRSELRPSYFNEIGGNLETVTEMNGGRLIRHLKLTSGQPWPSNDAYRRKYLGPDIIFYFKSPSTASDIQQVRIVRPDSCTLSKNGMAVGKESAELTLRPGDVFSLFDQKTNNHSTFVYGYQNRFELLYSNQINTKDDAIEASALAVGRLPNEYQVIGYVVTDDLLRSMSTIDIQRFTKTMQWDPVGLLEYRYVSAEYQELAIPQISLSNSFVYAYLKLDQTSLPLVPEAYLTKAELEKVKLDLDLDTHLIAHDSRLGITYHLKVLPSGLIATYTERNSPSLKDTTGRDQTEPDVRQTRPPAHEFQPSAPSPTYLSATVQSTRVVRPLGRDPNSEKPSIQRSTSELPKSTLAEVGSRVQMHNQSGLSPWISEVLFKKGSRWPIEGGFGQTYTGPDMIISINSAADETPLLNIESSATLRLIVNGGTKPFTDNVAVLKPGDVITVIDTTTNLSSTFLYGYTKKFELVATNQAGTTPDYHTVPAIGKFGGLESIEVIGYVMTDELSRDNSFTDYPQFNKTIHWGDYGTLEYRCGMSFSRKLTLTKSRSASALDMSLVATSLQGNVPLTPIEHSQELTIGSHVIVEDKNRSKMTHLRVLDSGLIVAFTLNVKDLTTRVNEGSTQRSVGDLAMSHERETLSSPRFEYFPTQAGCTLGTGFELEQLRWEKDHPNPNVVSRVTIGELLAPTGFRVENFAGGSNSVFQLRKWEEDLPALGYNTLHITGLGTRIESINGAIKTDGSVQEFLSPGDVCVLVNDHSGEKYTLFYSYHRTIELLRAENTKRGTHISIDDLYKLLTSKVKILGFHGEQRIYTRYPAHENYSKYISWPDGKVQIHSEISSTGTQIRLTIEGNLATPYEYALTDRDGYTTKITRLPYDLTRDCLVTASDLTSTKRFHMRVLPSGLIVSY